MVIMDVSVCLCAVYKGCKLSVTKQSIDSAYAQRMTMSEPLRVRFLLEFLQSNFELTKRLFPKASNRIQTNTLTMTLTLSLSDYI